MPRALLSVSDKTGIVESGPRPRRPRLRARVDRRHRARAGRRRPARHRACPTLTGFPEMMDGRVKTLHPALHGGILARRDRADDLAALERHGIGLVDRGRRQPVSVRRGGREPGDAVRRARRGDRHRRAVARARGRQELPRRARRRRPGGLSAAARRARRDAERSRSGSSSMRKALAHTAAYDTGHHADARRR